MKKSGLHDPFNGSPARLHLTKRELLNLLEIASHSLRINTDEQLRDLLLSVCDLIPCTNIVTGLGRTEPSGNLDVIKIINVSYPLEWLLLYFQRNYALVDPVLRTHFGRFETQVWSETFRGATSRTERDFLDHARQFGLSQGVTLGLACRQGPAGSLFSFAGQSLGEHVRHQVVLEYLIPHLHVALMRTAFPPSQVNPNLTIREREVLKWIKEGKTNWEISQTLHISERTVKFHVHNIMAKFGASSRGHAVALGMEHAEKLRRLGMKFDLTLRSRRGGSQIVNATKRPIDL